MIKMRQAALWLAAVGSVMTVTVHAQIPTGVEFEKFYDQAKINFLQPTYIGPVPNDATQIVVVERAGKVSRLVKNASGGWDKVAWFTVPANVHTHWDGCWNVTFHPKFAENHRFFVLYRTTGGDTHSVLEEWTCDANLANPHKVKDIITFRQANTEPDGGIHSSGDVHFGPDGLLYTSQGDRHLFDKGAPDMSELWGKVSRIDVDKPDGAKPYSIPADNPYVGQAGVRPEIWAGCFRVPYRFSFDALNGDLYLGDVGDVDHEEVNLVTAKKDFGSGRKNGDGSWVEGNCKSNCTNWTNPILELPHGCVIGGVVYRNDPASAFYGTYIYADYQRTLLLALKMNGTKNGTTEAKTLGTPPGRISTMGIDAVGNIYVGTYVEAGSNTQIYRLKHAELKAAPSPTFLAQRRAPKAISFKDLGSDRYKVYGLDGKVQTGAKASTGALRIVRDVKTGETQKFVQLP